MRKLAFEEINKTRCVSVDEVGKLERNPVIIICENIRSLYNVGSIFRTLDGIRAERLYLCGYTGYPPRKEIDKVSLGAVDSVPWEYEKDTLKVIERLKKDGIPVIALEHTDTSVNFQEFEYSFPLSVVLGNEYEGISDEVVAHCDSAVEIPMYGVKQSLNVAVACGVIGYELLRRLNSKKIIMQQSP